MIYMRCCVLITLGVALVQAVPTNAQYPNRPIRLIVAFGAGSANDVVARMIGPPLSKVLGRQVVIDNRPGAAGNLGAEIAANSPADGYTVMMGNISHAISMTLYSNPGYDLLKDFAPVAGLVSSSFLLVAHPSVPVKTVHELIAFAKARPDQINVATSGSGIFLASQLFNGMAGIRMMNVTYKSTPQAMTAVIGGEVSVGFPGTSSALPHVKSGKLHALATTGARRAPVLPDLPTISEAGLPGYEASPWYGLLVKSGTVAEIIAMLHSESLKVIRQPDVLERFRAADLDPIGLAPEQFGTYIRNEIAKWGKIVRATGLRPD